MSKNLYKPCPYCGNDILKKPILERQQGEYSILCPYCLTHRSEWAGADTIEKAVISWNIHARDDTRGVIYYSEILSEFSEKMLLESLELNDFKTENIAKTSSKKYIVKNCWSQLQLDVTAVRKRYIHVQREPVNRTEQELYEADEKNNILERHGAVIYVQR